MDESHIMGASFGDRRCAVGEKSRIMLAIIMAIAGAVATPEQSSFPEDSLIELRIDCDVTATLHRNGRSEPYGGGEYIFLLASAYGSAKGNPSDIFPRFTMAEPF